ncbi:MAG: DUF4835 family protein [Bacteroidota bacterium]|nr:DUF4835 family protein [Bacteroidota bacterium]
MRNFLVIILILFLSEFVHSQELNCSVSVNSQQIQGSDKKIFETMQSAITEFVNQKKWTNNVFKVEEKIECSILITITERTTVDHFKGNILVQSRRPVFKTSYNSVMLNLKDNDFEFDYTQSQNMDFSDNTFSSNLTSVLAYYVNIILGLDYDSFSLNGGNTYFLKAQTIVNNAQNASEKGWKSYESNKNRYWLVENLLNPIFSPVRQFLYEYHLKGLDIMSDKTEAGRTNILNSIENLVQVHREKPSSFLMQVIFTAKADEIVNIFSQAPQSDKSKVVGFLNEIDAANIPKYKKISGNQ